MAGPSEHRYLRLRIRLPASAWPVLRAVTMASVVALAAVLLVDGDLGLAVLWGLVVPALPLAFVLAPGLWRNVCPMAAANQLPRGFGLLQERRPPRWLERHGYTIAALLFFALAGTRPVLLEHSGAAAALLLGLALLVPFVTGMLFRGKSGYCGTICPLRPAQGLYSRAPVVQVTNAHCRPCVSCTENCPDLKPSTALLDDLRSDDRIRRGGRRVFAGALPGFTFAFFTLPPPGQAGVAGWAAQLLVAMLVGVGALAALESMTRLTAAQLTAIAGAASLALFYWFNLPVVASTVGNLTGTEPAPWAVWEARAAVLVIVGWWLARSLRRTARPARAVPLHSQALATRAAGAPAGPAPAGASLPVVERRGRGASPGRVVAGEPAVEIPDRRSPRRPLRGPVVTLWPEGRQVEVEPGATVKAAAAAAGIALPEGCGTGLCGCDPLYVLAGEGSLTAPGDDERMTLERLGLPPHARLACAAVVTGDVTLSADADARLPADRPAAAPAPADPAGETPAPAIALAGVERVVIVGNGVAGVTAASHVRRLHPGCRVELITDSPHPFYNRIAITRLIHERTGMQGMHLMPDRWYEEQRIVQWLNTRVLGVDVDRKRVRLGTGEALDYDRLILATGARAALPALAGVGLEGVFPLRHADDALGVRAYLQEQRCRRAVVVGGGLLGVEAADALAKVGLDVTIVHHGPRLAGMDLDERAGALLQDAMRGRGIETLVGTAASAVFGSRRAEGVELSDGRRLDAELVLLCTGIRPNAELARLAGLHVARGIVVDEHMRTSHPDVLACGDVAEFAGQLSGRWPSAVAQAEVAAVTALGGRRAFSPVPIPTRLKVTAVELTAIGKPAAGDQDEEHVLEDEAGGRYRKLVVTGGRAAGAVVFGEPTGLDALLAAVRTGDDAEAALAALRAGSWVAAEPRRRPAA